jgi:hypothetical protein
MPESNGQVKLELEDESEIVFVCHDFYILDWIGFGDLKLYSPNFLNKPLNPFFCCWPGWP